MAAAPRTSRLNLELAHDRCAPLDGLVLETRIELPLDGFLRGCAALARPVEQGPPRLGEHPGGVLHALQRCPRGRFGLAALRRPLNCEEPRLLHVSACEPRTGHCRSLLRALALEQLGDARRRHRAEANWLAT